MDLQLASATQSRRSEYFKYFPNKISYLNQVFESENNVEYTW